MLRNTYGERSLPVAIVALLCGAAANAMSPQFQQAVLSSAPVLYYKLNETTGNAIDYGSRGAALNAVYNGMPIRGIPTREGDAGVAFTGINDFLESLGTASAELTGNPSFSIEAVVFLPSSGTASITKNRLRATHSSAASVSRPSVISRRRSHSTPKISASSAARVPPIHGSV